MTRYALGIVGVLAFSGLALAGPADMFEEKEKDFGVSPKGTVLVHYFRFTNTTKHTVTLGQPRVSCGCVTPALTKNQIAPGETAAVIAYMDTRRIPNAGVTKTRHRVRAVHRPDLRGGVAEGARPSPATTC